MVPLEYLPCEEDEGGGSKIRNRKTYRVVFETRGQAFRLRSEHELPNVVFVPGVNDYRYVLIDFEHGSEGGLKVSERFEGLGRCNAHEE
ncbi:1239_t:CDS:2 [Funneliformis mosseae]|uniref:1239_t:CDS:1 n=1 Tax=Funneliformis mosseae TaxID=27381 RepID=A0A9N9EEB2_FUNMO|nr:1239_t:CDS:2 [Funneliformis mosseae]